MYGDPSQPFVVKLLYVDMPFGQILDQSPPAAAGKIETILG